MEGQTSSVDEELRTLRNFFNCNITRESHICSVIRTSVSTNDQSSCPQRAHRLPLKAPFLRRKHSTSFHPYIRSFHDSFPIPSILTLSLVFHPRISLQRQRQSRSKFSWRGIQWRCCLMWIGRWKNRWRR